MMFYVNNFGFDHLDEAIEVAKAVKTNVTEQDVVVFSYTRWNTEIEEAENKFIVNGQMLLNGQTLLYEADRLWEVAAIRGVISFDDFAKFYRRLIPLLEELGISLDSDDERKARLEAEG